MKRPKAEGSKKRFWVDDVVLKDFPQRFKPSKRARGLRAAFTVLSLGPGQPDPPSAGVSPPPVNLFPRPSAAPVFQLWANYCHKLSFSLWLN